MKGKKTTISIIIAVAVLIAVAVSGLGYAELKKSTQSQSQLGAKEELIAKDPFGKEQVLIGVLNYDISGEVLGAEIDLNKYQTEQIVKIAREEEDDMRIARGRAPKPKGWNKTYEDIFNETAKKLQKLLSPLQYAKLKDWVLEESVLVDNSMRRKQSRPLLEVKPITFFTMNFFQNQLELSEKEYETARQLIYQIKQELLPLREEFEEVKGNPHADKIKKERTAEQVIKQISPKIQKLEADIFKILPASKRKLYKSLIEALPGE